MSSLAMICCAPCKSDKSSVQGLGCIESMELDKDTLFRISAVMSNAGQEATSELLGAMERLEDALGINASFPEYREYQAAKGMKS